jgi:hypothetical protein
LAEAGRRPCRPCGNGDRCNAGVHGAKETHSDPFRNAFCQYSLLGVMLPATAVQGTVAHEMVSTLVGSRPVSAERSVCHQSSRGEATVLVTHDLRAPLAVGSRVNSDGAKFDLRPVTCFHPACGFPMLHPMAENGKVSSSTYRLLPVGLLGSLKARVEAASGGFRWT